MTAATAAVAWPRRYMAIVFLKLGCDQCPYNIFGMIFRLLWCVGFSYLKSVLLAVELEFIVMAMVCKNVLYFTPTQK